MTRINLVEVDSLADQHLFAEWREIKMVPAALRRYLTTNTSKVMMGKVGPVFKLGQGHVSFFYNKMKFLTERYEKLTTEVLKRGYKIENILPFTAYTVEIPLEFSMLDWSPSVNEIAESRNRILIRISEKPDWYRYYGTPQDLEFFKKKLND